MKTLLAIDWSKLEDAGAPKFKGQGFSEVISAILPLVFIIAGMILLFFLLYSGFQYMTSAGDPKALQQARANITYSIVGFLVIFASYWMVQALGVVLKFTGLGGIF